MGKYLEFLAEQEDIWAKPKELADRVAEYIQEKLTKISVRASEQITKARKENKVGGPDRISISFSGYPLSQYDYYNVSVTINDPDKITLDFEEKKETSRESLADPSKNYQTTTAAYIKFKKRAIRRKEFDSYQKAITAIDKWFDKKDW